MSAIACVMRWVWIVIEAKWGVVGHRPSYKMWILKLLDNADIIQLDVQVLVNALQCAADLNIILELDGDLMVHEGLEEAVIVN